MSDLYEFVNGIELDSVYICDPDKSPCRGSEFCHKPGGCFYTTDKDRALDPSTPLYMTESLKKVNRELPAVKLHNLRADIEALNPVDYVSMSSCEGHKGASDMKDDVLQIIDKLSAENEELAKINQNLNMDSVRALCWCLDVIDKLKDELHANAEMHDDGDYYLRDEWVDVILDKKLKLMESNIITLGSLKDASNTEQEPIGHCKDCKHFEYDSVAKVDGIPLIVAHEICKRWGDGCKTKEDGYCFLFEPQERSDHEST